MSSLLPFLIIGVTTGSLYGLAGLGLVLTYRTSGVFNFGHGAIAAGAAFVFYSFHVTLGWPWPIAALATLALFATVVGWLLERITRNLRGVPEAIVVVATVGILLGTEGLLYLRYGDQTRESPQFLPSSGFTVSGVNVSWAKVISFTVSTVAAAALYVFLRRSRLGVAMRAVVDNPTLVALSGERAARIRGASWAIGSAFAALSGILLAPTLGLDPNLLTLLVVQAFGACAIGCFSNLPLTYAGGMVVGVAASLSTKYFTHEPFTQLPSTVPYLFLIVVLLFVPVAKLPQRRVTIRSLVADPRRLPSWAAAPLAVSAAALLLTVPALVGARLPLWTNGLTYVVIFGSLALLVWMSGQISLCHMAFVAVGATTMSHLVHHGVPWLVAVALAGALTAPVGALVAIPAIRLSGIYLALITLGFGILMQNVVFGTGLMFGSSLTATAARPKLGFIDATNDKWFYYIVLAFAAATCLVLAAIQRSRLGRLLRAMSEAPIMLTTHGLGLVVTRLLVFCLSAFFAGIAGALAITETGAASGMSYGPIQSLLLLAVLAICGTRLLPSSILAAGAMAILPGYVTQFGVDRQIFAFGIAAVAAALIIARRTGSTGVASQRVSPALLDRAARSPVADRWSTYSRPRRLGRSPQSVGAGGIAP